MRRALVLLVLAFLAASVYLFAWAPFAAPNPRHADALVVLAGSGTRLPVALDLFRRGVAPQLLISRDPRDLPRARLCRLPPTGVTCFRPHPSSTQGEARTATRIARRHGWRSLAIVSSRFHLFRARLIFRRCTEARLELVPAPVTWWKWPEAIASEWTKLAVALTTRRRC